MKTIMRATLAAVVVLCAHSARAVEINACFVLTDMDEKPILDGAEGDKERPVLTLGRVAARGLLAAFQEDAATPGEKKRIRGDLGMRLYNASRIGEKTKALCNIDLTAEELALAKEYVAKIWSPLVISRAWPVFDGKKPDK